MATISGLAISGIFSFNCIMAPPGCTSPIPPHWALAFTDSLASYMVARFRSAVGPGSGDHLDWMTCPMVSLETLCEANSMVSMLVAAFKNKGQRFHTRCLPSADRICHSNHSGCRHYSAYRVCSQMPSGTRLTGPQDSLFAS